MAECCLRFSSPWHGHHVRYVVEADLKFRRESETKGVVRRMMKYQSQVPDRPCNSLPVVSMDMRVLDLAVTMFVAMRQAGFFQQTDA